MCKHNTCSKPLHSTSGSFHSEDELQCYGLDQLEQGFSTFFLTFTPCQLPNTKFTPCFVYLLALWKMYNSIIKFTPRIDQTYPQVVNLPPVENPWTIAKKGPENGFCFPVLLLRLNTQHVAGLQCGATDAANIVRASRNKAQAEMRLSPRVHPLGEVPSNMNWNT